MSEAISVSNLSIGWASRNTRVLAADISLQLEKGKLAILVGPNGSGKSTFLRTLVGLQPPIRGEVSLCETSLKSLSIEERARLAACVFTERFDAGYFSVFDIVAFGRYPYTDRRGSLSDTDVREIEAAIAAVGLSELIRRRFAELSDGERQKALIARAIAQDCPILVLDEPTAFLDAPARIEIFHLVRRLAHSSGKAVVVSTHDIDHALRFADRLWLIDGKLHFYNGAPEDLAVSGSIGKAFDRDIYRFDAQYGIFGSTTPEATPLAVEVIGQEGTARAWTLRLIERLGIVEAQRGEVAVARIHIEEGQAGPTFILTSGSSKYPARSYSELERSLGLALRLDSLSSTGAASEV